MEGNGRAAFEAWESFRREMAKKEALKEQKEIIHDEIKEVHYSFDEKSEKVPKVGEAGYLNASKKILREAYKKGDERWFGKREGFDREV